MICSNSDARIQDITRQSLFHHVWYAKLICNFLSLFTIVLNVGTKVWSICSWRSKHSKRGPNCSFISSSLLWWVSSWWNFGLNQRREAWNPSFQWPQNRVKALVPCSMAGVNGGMVTRGVKDDSREDDDEKPGMEENQQGREVTVIAMRWKYSKWFFLMTDHWYVKLYIYSN